MIRTVTAVERADVVIVMIDASEGVTEQDAKIAGIAHERGRALSLPSTNGMRLRRTIRQSTNIQTESVRFWHICRMQNWYLSLQRQA